MPAVAVTDTNNLFGALEASVTLAGAGIQPITGIQQSLNAADFSLPLARGARHPSVVLLAQSEAGYRNLLKISSEALLNSASEDASCSCLSRLAQHHEGVICLTGGYDGPVDRLLREGRIDDARAALETIGCALSGPALCGATPAPVSRL